MKKDIILTTTEIQHKINRIAYQIYESNVDETELIIAGIFKNGYTFAQKLQAKLEEISAINVQLCKITIDKRNPLNTVDTNIDLEVFANKSVVLADDVLNTGKTLIYAAQYLLNVPLKKLKTTVLVNRNHKNFPIKADFKGLSLSTSSHNTIEVSFEDEDMVYLT